MTMEKYTEKSQNYVDKGEAKIEKVRRRKQATVGEKVPIQGLDRVI